MKCYVGLCSNLGDPLLYVTDDVDCMPPDLLAQPQLEALEVPTPYEAAYQFAEKHDFHGRVVINTSEEFVEASL